MAIFSSDLKDTIKRLSNKEFSTTEERDELLREFLVQAYPTRQTQDG